MIKRYRLYFFLLQEAEYLKEHKSDKKLLGALNAAVTGLENLQFGQVDDIFAPSKLGLHGSRRADVKRCQAHAVGTVFALRKRGYKVADADEVVAKAFVISLDNLREWKKTLKKTKNRVLREIVAFYKYQVIFSTDVTGILADIERKAVLYKKAHAPEKVKKTE